MSDEWRAKVQEARAENIRRARTLRDEGPLPEFYPGHYDDLLGLPHDPNAEADYWAARGLIPPKPEPLS